MTHYKTMVVFQGESNLAEDRFINTWHFEKVGQIGLQSGDVDDIHQLLFEFYNTTAGTGAHSIIDRMPADVLTSEIQFRTYHMADEEPRQPHIDTVAATFGAGTPLPTECAIAFSFHGNRSIPRERGRVYLGPFVSIAGQVGSSGKGLIVADTMRSCIITNAANMLTNQGNFPNLKWSVFSPTRKDAGLGFSGLTHVTGGWVDNAWDTQRRRGTDATARSTFGSAIPPV